MPQSKGREIPDSTAPQIQSIRIRNFRGFEDIQLDSIQQVNLITGMNNVGKTALLDAIFVQLAPNNPELLLRTNAFRGIERADAESEEVWGGFFYDRKIDRKIEITTKYTDYTQSILRISLETSNRSQSASRRSTGSARPLFSTTQTKRDELVFSLKRGSGADLISRAIIDADGELKFDRAALRNLRNGIFFGTRTRNLQEDA